MPDGPIIANNTPLVALSGINGVFQLSGSEPLSIGKGFHVGSG